MERLDIDRCCFLCVSWICGSGHRVIRSGNEISYIRCATHWRFCPRYWNPVSLRCCWFVSVGGSLLLFPIRWKSDSPSREHIISKLLRQPPQLLHSVCVCPPCDPSREWAVVICSRQAAANPIESSQFPSSENGIKMFVIIWHLLLHILEWFFNQLDMFNGNWLRGNKKKKKIV